MPPPIFVPHFPVRKTLSDKGVAALKPRAKTYHHADPQLPLHYVRVQPSGVKSFYVAPRDPAGKQRWVRIGDTAVVSIAEARDQGREIIKRVHAGLSAVEVTGETFAAVAANFLKRHVASSGLRSRPEIERLLASLVLPAWRDREFVSIGRSDVAKLLDQIEDHNGARQADYVLAITRKIANWYATRHNTYAPPFVKGMARRTAKERERTRILNDDEIRQVWKAAEADGIFGDLVRLLLLTAQRREKVVSMRWQDIAADRTWTIPREAREKGAPVELMLPTAALAIIQSRPQIGSNPYVLAAARGNGPFRGFSKAKREFDAACGVTDWTLHDLRRTARSLMSRAGVSTEHAERTLGHARPGVEGVYDRHHYRDEVHGALERLATLLDGIVNERENVVPLQRRQR
jgi:integrase